MPHRTEGAIRAFLTSTVTVGLCRPQADAQAVSGATATIRPARMAIRVILVQLVMIAVLRVGPQPPSRDEEPTGRSAR